MSSACPYYHTNFNQMVQQLGPTEQSSRIQRHVTNLWNETTTEPSSSHAYWGHFLVQLRISHVMHMHAVSIFIHPNFPPKLMIKRLQIVRFQILNWTNSKVDPLVQPFRPNIHIIKVYLDSKQTKIKNREYVQTLTDLIRL